MSQVSLAFELVIDMYGRVKGVGRSNLEAEVFGKFTSFYRVHGYRAPELKAIFSF